VFVAFVFLRILL